MAAGPTFEPIASVTLSANQTIVTFTAIPQNFTDLVLAMVPASSSGTNGIRMRINGDASSLYSGTYLDGTGSSAGSWRDSGAANMQLTYRLGIDTSLTQAYTLQFQNYSNTTTFKPVLIRYTSGSSATGLGSGLWRSTSAITSISFNINSFGSSTGDFIAGSTFDLFGIAAA